VLCEMRISFSHCLSCFKKCILSIRNYHVLYATEAISYTFLLIFIKPLKCRTFISARVSDVRRPFIATLLWFTLHYSLVVAENCAFLGSRCVTSQNTAVLNWRILSITCKIVARQLSTQVCHNAGLPTTPSFVNFIISLGTKDPAEYAAGINIININVHFYQVYPHDGH
jgi:hypothetical protein